METDRHFPMLTGSDADQRLRSLVHPPGWVNPTPQGRYHLVVIGAGTAGLVSAAIAAGLGARVAIVERTLMGGDCLNVGCVPSKALIRAARSWHEARRSSSVFGGPATTRDNAGDFTVVMERLRALRASIAEVDSAERYRELGVDVFLGDARFTGRSTVEVGGRTLEFRRAIIATGARAAAPPIPGLAESGYLTNETVFAIDTLPPRLIVIGGGPIGCELAQAFARLGSNVSLLEAGPRLLAKDDPDAAAIVERALAHDGVHVRTSAKIMSVERRTDVRRMQLDGGEWLEAEALLVAAGRAPNVDAMGLEPAGVQFGPRGVIVNDRMRTSNRNVYAIGDVASRFQFTHAADAQARLVVPNALFFGLGGGKSSSLVMSWCTYTSPEVAHVGMSAADAAGRADVESVTVTLDHIDRARLEGEEDGFLRVHLRRGSDRILGATLVAERAGDMIGEVAAAITNKVGLSGLGRTIHPYPTVASIFARAADQHRRAKLTPTAKRAFSRYFRIFN